MTEVVVATGGWEKRVRAATGVHFHPFFDSVGTSPNLCPVLERPSRRDGWDR
jgi:hypothetical protein